MVTANVRNHMQIKNLPSALKRCTEYIKYNGKIIAAYLNFKNRSNDDNNQANALNLSEELKNIA